MYSCKHNEESIDLKLMLIYVGKHIVAWVLATILVTALFAGAYLLKTFVFSGEKKYVAKSVMYLEYNERVKLDNVYINHYTWQELICTDEFINTVLEQLNGSVDRDFLLSSVSAGLETDVRVLILKATANNPELAISLAQAYEEALITFGTQLEDIDEMKVLTHATTATPPEIDNRIVKVTLCGLVTGAIFSFLLLCFRFVTDDSIYTPISFERRYGYPVIGMFTSNGKEVFPGETVCNIKVILRECEQVIVSGAQFDNEGETAMKLLMDNQIKLPNKMKLSAAPTINQAPEKMEELLGQDGVVLVVKAGVRNSVIIEKTINYIDKQGGKILGVIIYHGDRKILKSYYTFRKAKKGEEEACDSNC